MNMGQKIIFKFIATTPPPPTHPGPPPISPCTKCSIGCENGKEPEPGTVTIKFFLKFELDKCF